MEVTVRWPVFHDSIEIVTFEVNIKCYLNRYHNHVKTNWISVNQINIQLIQFISTKVFYTYFIPSLDDIQEYIFLQIAKSFFFFKAAFSENIIVELWPIALLF